MNNEKKITSIALQTIHIEAEAIQKLTQSINSDFCQAVDAIFRSKGRLIVAGIGKSAIIAQKVVATLNSTGTPAIFMHAADAIHGDLGVIRPEDIVLCISKSGETPEIKVLIPLLKNLGNLLIGMVSTLESTLGQQAQFVLHTPITKEADPNNLAPTTSTTTQMVMGDALATSLLALRGFTPADFAQFHPGGALGKQLYLRVESLYPNNAQPIVYLSDNIEKIILEMTSKRLGMTVVLDEAENIKGVITDGDLRRMLERRSKLEGLHAKEIMSVNPKVIEQSAMAVEALGIMRNASITQLIVVNEGRYVGIIHLHDLIREGLI
ncbi:MAG: SIS domain-containing protein [Saprospiraceae bacterium]